MSEKKLNPIEQFIKDNELEFTGGGSSLNGNCTVIAGYACHQGISEEYTFIQQFNVTELSEEAEKELRRVFNYADSNNYGDYWKTEEAKKIYEF